MWLIDFKVISLDFNEDDALCSADLSKVLDYLTGGKLSEESKEHIIERVSIEGSVFWS